MVGRAFTSRETGMIKEIQQKNKASTSKTINKYHGKNQNNWAKQAKRWF